MLSTPWAPPRLQPKTQTMVENESSTDRYYAIGATYANGPVNLYFAVDSVNYASYFGVALARLRLKQTLRRT